MPLPKRTPAFDRWLEEIKRRLPDECVAALCESSSPLKSLLPALFRHHVEDPRFAMIQPPLPGLPRVDLKDWVELRVIPDVRLGRFQPIVMEGHPVQLTKSTLTVERLMQESDPLIVVGEPGCGKSTILLWAAHRMILRPNMRSVIPLHIPLGRFVRWQQHHADRSVYHFFWENILHLPPAGADSFHEFMLLAEGDSEAVRSQYQILLDGWDETPRHLRSDLKTWVERFEYTFPTMMTSRPVAYASELPSWVRHEVAPLTFGAMWQVISRLAYLMKQPGLIDIISDYLDRHPSLRAFARNPFVLTLVFAVVSSNRREFPRTRASLYAAAVELMRQFCVLHQHEHGLTFSKQQVEETQLAALELLRRTDTVPYEFREGEVTISELFPRWQTARMITPTGDDDGGHRFVHASLHESLAGIGIARKLANNEIILNDCGLTVAWLETLRFTFGALEDLPDAVQEPLLAWLSRVCEQADEFVVMLAHAANLLAEAGLSHRAAELLGQDIQPKLWQAFLHAPDSQLYAQAIVQVGLDYALEQLAALPAVTTDLVARISLLYFLTPTEDSRRSGFISLLTKPLINPDPSGTSFAELPDLETALGYSPDDASSIRSSQDTRSAADLIHEIGDLRGEARERPALMVLARTKTAEAEDYLIHELRAESDPKRLADLAEALQQLGSIAARDSMLDSLNLWEDRPIHLAIVLRSLIGLFIDRSAETVLRFVEPNWPEEVRIAAALVLAHCDRARILNQLADKACPEEPNLQVRKAVLISLIRARSFGLLSSLNLESSRSDETEQALIWEYLGAVGRQISSTRDYGQHRSTIERLFLRELNRFQVPPLRLMQEAATLRGSSAIATCLAAVLEDVSAEVASRATALHGLAQLQKLPPITTLMKDFTASVNTPGEELLARAFATVIAQTQPELLLGVTNPFARHALWEFSLTTNRLVFADRIQSVEEPLLVNRQPATAPAAGGFAPANEVTATPEAANLQTTIENLAAVMKWMRENVAPGDPDGPPRMPDETQLMVAWMDSHHLNESPKAAYRAAALFCSCHNMSLPIIKSEWGLRSEKAVFERGLSMLRQWKPLLDLLGIDQQNDVDSFRRAYQRGCETMAQQRPLERPHSLVDQADLGPSHRNKYDER